MRSAIGAATSTMAAEAGQTAPGGGIGVRGRRVTFGGSNQMIRFMRFRHGVVTTSTAEDTVIIASLATNVIVDHCSVGFGIDETFSMPGSERQDSRRRSALSRAAYHGGARASSSCRIRKLIPVVALSLAIVATVGGSDAGKDNSGPWQALYTVVGHDQWLTAVWSRRDGAWFAGGKNVIVSRTEGVAKATEIPRGTVVYRFGEDSAGRVFAVGLPGMVWEREAEGFRIVLQSRPPARKGKAAYQDLLYGIGYLDPASGTTLMAYGPNDLIAYRLPTGTWETKRDKALASFALTGPPKVSLPEGCQRLHWRWLARNEAFLLCHDSRVFLVSNQVASAASRLPAACKDDVYAVSRDGTDLYASCGPKQQLWLHRVDERSWALVQGAPSGVRDVVARDGCVVLVTERRVWRRCGGKAK
jgi:hypothetical protein